MSHPLAPKTLRYGLTFSAAALITTALTPLAAHAQDSTWNGVGNNFNSGANWTPNSVPTNRATFSNTGLTGIGIIGVTTLNQFRFAPNSQNYGITIFSGGSSLTLNGIGGVGIDNQGPSFQTININGAMTLNSASVLNSGGGTIVLNNVSNGGNAVLTLNGTTQLGSNVVLQANGGDAIANGTTVTITGSAATVFNNNSTADNRSVAQAGGTAVAVGFGGNDAVAVGGIATMTFNQTAHADNATFNLSDGGSVAVDSGADATAVAGSSLVVFNNGSHADSATFNSTDGGTTSVASFDGNITTAVGGASTITFNGTSHADNATFNTTGAGVTSVGGSGRVGTPGGTGLAGGLAIGVGGAVSVNLLDNSHANSATIVNLAGSAISVGGTGGAGDTGTGGAGGAGQAFGTSVGLNVANNASLNNSAVINTVQSTIGVGGGGGAGGAAGAGGVGGSSLAFGGNINVTINNNATVTGTIFNNTAGGAEATGGTGGAGGAGGNGGAGGATTVTGGNATITVAGNVTLGAGNIINNTAGDAKATGGLGGTGGTGGTGGAGGTASATGGAATVRFEDNASAGSASIVNRGGTTSSTGGSGGAGGTGAGGNGGFSSAVQGQALVLFTDTSTAGSATIQNIGGQPATLAGGTQGATGGGGGAGGFASGASLALNAPEIRFGNSATGGSAHITNTRGLVSFNENSIFGTAAGGGARIDNNVGGEVEFNDSSSLGNGQIVNAGGVNFSFVTFHDTSTAGTGSITNSNANSIFSFNDNSTLGSATVTNSGSLSFNNSSDGVAGSVVNNAGGTTGVFVDGFRLGSLSGSGNVNINSTSLQVGYLDRNETFAGVIGGTGLLVKRGTGTFTLTGTNTYAGGTAVEAGTLQIGNGGTTGSITGNITDNANVTFNRSDTVTFANVISGSGTVTKAGAGTLVLTGTNTYAGGTTISAGTLQLGNGGTTGSVVGNITNNAALVLNRLNNIALSGVISGTGTLTQAGTGNVFLTGANTYTGLTTISSGTLRVGNGGTQGSIVSNVLNNSAFEFNRSNTYLYAGNISGTGTVTSLSIGTIVLTGTNTYTGGTFINAGTIQVGNGGTTGSIVGNVVATNNSILAFNRSDTITYAGAVSGATGSIHQIGTGTLILTGASTQSGGTFVDAGTIQLDGSLAFGTVVGAAGRLTGTGIVNNGIVNNGVIAPGNAATPFGTLTATGQIIFNAGSFLAPTLNSAGQTSFLQAGTLTINGGQVRPTAVAGGLFLLQTDYRIANATTARNGTFTGVDESQLPSFLDASLFYTGNDVFLRIRRNATNFAQAAGLTPNQAAVGGSLDAGLAGGNPLVFTTYLGTYNSLLPLSGAQLQGALNILSGDALAAFPVVAQEHANRFADRLNAYTWSNSSNLWGLIAYGDQDADGDGNGPGFKANGVEFQMGFNTSLGHDTRLGLSVGMNNGDVTVDDRLTTGNVDTWSVGAQLRHDFGQIYASGQFTYSWHSIDSSRPLFLPGTATADYDAHSWTAGGELGWVIHSGQLSIEPHLSVRHASTSTDAYTESGPVGALNVAAADYETTRLGIGIRLANRTPEAPVKFYAMLRYERETGDEQSALDNALPGLPTFRVVSTRLGDDIISGEVGAEFRISNGLSLFAAGGGHTRSNETSLQANTGLRVRF